MAVVGEASIIVRAVTNRIRPDIERAFSGLDAIGEREGAKISNAFSRGLKSGGGGDGKIFSAKFLGEAEAARRAFNKLVQVGYFLGPAISGVVGAIGALGAGLVSLVSILGAATPALFAVAGALASVGIAAVTAKLAFGGVGAALQAGIKAQKGSVNNTRAIEQAENRLADARVRLRRLLNEEQYERIAEAQRRAADAENSAVDAQISSIRSVRAYNDAQKRTKKALEDLNDARDEAREKIQQLRFEVEGGAISEKKARLEFEKARDALQRVQDLPPNSRARQEAELAFAEADLNLRRAIDRNKDLKKEEADATRLGVEGSKQVVAAKDAIAQAQIAEKDAAIDAARAIRDAAIARKDADQAAQDASKDGKVIRDINRDIADAREAVREANKDLDEAKKGGSSANAFADAMKELSPEAQKFVEFLIGIRGEFQKLRAAAGRELFPKLEVAIQTLVDKLFPVLEPALERIGGKLGDFAVDFADAITSTQNLKNIDAIFKNSEGVIDDLSGVTSNLTGVFLALLRAAGPLTRRFTTWLEKLTKSWEMSLNTEDGIKKMTSRFNKAGDVAARIGGIFRNLIDAFKEIGKAVMNGGAGELLLTYFEDATKGFADLMKQMNADGSLGEYFLKATENATKVLDLLGNIVAEILKLGDDEGVGKFVDSLSRATDTFGEIGAVLNTGAPALGTFVEQFALLIKNLTESGSINIFFEILTDVLGVVNDIVGSPFGKWLLGLLAPAFAVTRALGLIGRIGSFGFKVLVGNIMAPINMMKSFKGTLSKIPDAWTTLRLKGMYAMDAVKKGWSGITTAASTAKTGMLKAFQAAGTKIQAGAAAGLNGLKSVFATLGAAAKTAALAVGNALKAMALAVGRAMMTIGRFLMANPWILLIAALVAVVVLIIKNWDKIKEVVGNALKWVGEKVSAAWNWVKEKTSAVWNAIVSFITTIPQRLLDGIKALATTVLEFINKYHPIMVIWRLVTENWDKIKTFFTELPGKIKDAIVSLSTSVLEFINKYHPLLVLWRLINENWDKVKGWFTSLPGKILDSIRAMATTVWGFIKQYNPVTLLLNIAKSVWPTVSSFLSGKMTEIVNFIKGLPTRITTAAKGMWNGITNAFKDAINVIIRGWNKIEFKIPGFKVGPIGYSGFTLGLPDIKELAKGGVVKPTTGGTLARIAEAGRPERVEPLDPSGLSNRDRAIIDKLSGGPSKEVTINVYPSPGMDERELANLVSRQLAYQMRKGAA